MKEKIMKFGENACAAVILLTFYAAGYGVITSANRWAERESARLEAARAVVSNDVSPIRPPDVLEKSGFDERPDM